MKAPIIAALLLSAVGFARAAETASFLDIGVGARGLGMGGAYTALGDDANSLHWNQAGMARLEKTEVSASHAELFENTRLDHLTYAHPSAQGTFGAAFTYLSQGKIEGRDSAGHPTGGYAASDSAFDLAYARKTDVADLGVAVKYIRSHIGSAEAQTTAFDLGAKNEFGAVVVGAAARNMGPGLKYDDQRNDLPLRLALGVGYKFSGGHALAFELTNGPRGTGTDAAFGGEWQPIRNVMLRGGYTTKTTTAGGSGFDAARGLTLGMGLRNTKWMLDYAILPMGELGRSHRLTLGARF
ncbi:MAG: PorV/PorQ family protein [Elusimicrobiota bacterium]